MSHKERNRGQKSEDVRLFNDKTQELFFEALEDLSYLFSRGYGDKSSLQIVGNRYRLNSRQQKALLGMSASKESVKMRKAKEVAFFDMKGKTVDIDGFNLLIILESALSGAYVFKGLDGAYRDVSGVHGGYKKVSRTDEALKMIGEGLKDLGITHARWYLDAPISNSGRLKTLLRETAEKEDYPWEIILDNNPDKILNESDRVVISSDAWILEECGAWFNFNEWLIENKLKSPNIFLPKAKKKIALVACVKEKRQGKHQAKDLYIGEEFKAWMAFAEKEADETYILSGKYDLLHLEDEISSYDVNLNVQSQAYKDDWSKKVLRKLKSNADFNHDSFFLICNDTYMEDLKPHLKNAEIPFKIK